MAPDHENDTLHCEDDDTVTWGRRVNVCVCVCARASEESKPRFTSNPDISAKAKIRKMRVGYKEGTKPTREDPGGTRLAPQRPAQTGLLKDEHTAWPSSWPGPQGARGLMTQSYCKSRSKHLEDGAVSCSPVPRRTLQGPGGGVEGGAPFLPLYLTERPPGLSLPL